MLEINSLIKTFPQPGGGRLTVLDVPTLSLKKAEQVALVGQSGGGKTTLLHVIAGITAADSGEVIVDGVNISVLSESGRDRYRAARIGYVFQTFNLLAGYTAL